MIKSGTIKPYRIVELILRLKTVDTGLVRGIPVTAYNRRSRASVRMSYQ